MPRTKATPQRRLAEHAPANSSPLLLPPPQERDHRVFYVSDHDSESGSDSGGGLEEESGRVSRAHAATVDLTGASDESAQGPPAGGQSGKRRVMSTEKDGARPKPKQKQGSKTTKKSRVQEEAGVGRKHSFARLSGLLEQTAPVPAVSGGVRGGSPCSPGGYLTIALLSTLTFPEIDQERHGGNAEAEAGAELYLAGTGKQASLVVRCANVTVAAVQPAVLPALASHLAHLCGIIVGRSRKRGLPQLPQEQEVTTAALEQDAAQEAGSVWRLVRSQGPTATATGPQFELQATRVALEAADGLHLEVSSALLAALSPASQPLWAPRSSESEPHPFLASKFLEGATAYCTAQMLRRHPNGEQAALQQELEGLGLRSQLRPYQQKGVLSLRHSLLQGLQVETTTQRASRLGWREWGGRSHSSGSDSGSDSDQRLWYHRACQCMLLCRMEELPIKPDPPSPFASAIAVAKASAAVSPASAVPAAVLADEMGLGKTLQVLCLALLLKHKHEQEEGAKDQNVRQQRKQEQEQELDSPPPLRLLAHGLCDPRSMTCACERNVIRKSDLGALQCKECYNWCHVGCYGYSWAEAEALASADAFECLSCECLRCQGQPLESSAVLVCVPPTLLAQWQQEVRKHFAQPQVQAQAQQTGAAAVTAGAAALNVAVYTGCTVSTLLRSGSCLHSARPSQLARADVLLLPLSVLQKDYHVSSRFVADSSSEAGAGVASHGRQSRRASAVNSFFSYNETDDDNAFGSTGQGAVVNRYHPPPYEGVRFSLLAVDETQKMEGQAETRALAMTTRLLARRRLSLSATPLGRSRPDDLRSLMRFLQRQPFHGADSALQWRRAFEGSGLALSAEARDEQLASLLYPVVIRRTRQSVQAELALPPLTDSNRELTLSAFEMKMYADRVPAVLTKLRSSALTPADGSGHGVQELSDVRSGIDVLRRGCCHPQVFDRTLALRGSQTGAGAGTGAGTHAPRPFVEIMLLKVEQTRVAAEEQQRAQLMCLLAMASHAQLLHEADTNAGAGTGAGASAGTSEGLDVNSRYRSFWELAEAAYAVANALLRKGRDPVLLFGLAELTGAEHGSTAHGGEEDKEADRREDNGNGDAEAAPPAQQLSLTGHLHLVWRNRPGRRSRLGKDPNSPGGGGGVHLTDPEPYAHLHCHVSHRVLQLRVLAPPKAAHVSPCAEAAAKSASADGNKAVQCYPLLLEILCVPAGGGFLERVAELKVPLPDLFNSNTTAVSVLSPNADSDADMDVDTAAVAKVLASVDIPAESVRSKGWRVRIASFHDTAHEIGSSAPLSLNALLQMAGTGTSDSGSGSGCGSEQVIIPYVELQAVVKEAALDVDFAQELHMAHNYGDVLSATLAAAVPTGSKSEGAEVGISTSGSSGSTVGDRQLPLTILRPPWGKMGPSHRGAAGAAGSKAPEARSLKSAPVVVDVTPQTPPRTSQRRSRSHEEASSPLGPVALFAKAQAQQEQQQQQLEKEELMQRLQARAGAIEAAALSSRRQARLQAKAALGRLSDDVLERQGALSALSTGRRWWLPVLESLTHVSRASLLGALEEVVQPDVSGKAYAEIRAHVWDLPVVGATLNTAHEELWKARRSCLRAVTALADAPSQKEQAEAADCKVCKGYRFKSGPPCSQCRAHKVIDTYWLHLKTFRQKVTAMPAGVVPRGRGAAAAVGDEGLADREAETSTGHNANSVTGPFHMLASQLKRVSDCAVDGKQAAGQESSLAEVLKREATTMGLFATMHGDLLNAHDELFQNKTRLSRWPAGVEKPQGEEDLRLYDWEVRGRYETQWNNAVAHTAELTTAKGNLAFYRSQLSEVVGDPDPLSQAGTGGKCGGDCVICLNPLQVETTGDKEEDEGGSDSHGREAPVVLVGCSHRFHHDCIEIWLKTQKTCPMCKVRVKPQDLQAVLVTPVASPYRNSNRRKGKDSTAGSPSSHMGRWGTKVGALVSDIIALGRTVSEKVSGNISIGGDGDRDTSSDKILVFSQWREMLGIVSAALSAERVSHEFCFESAHFSPRGRLSRFKSAADCRVLLLPLAFGAEGLDLTEANHVMLLEPVVNAATEAQAIGRMLRLGQERPMTVHRYACANTVESYIQSFKHRQKQQQKQQQQQQQQQQRFPASSGSGSSSCGSGYTPVRRGQGGDLAELSASQLECLLVGQPRTIGDGGEAVSVGSNSSQSVEPETLVFH